MTDLGALIFFVLALLACFFALLQRERSEKRRLDSDKNLDIYEHLPRHYRNLSGVEARLSMAEEYRLFHNWEAAKLNIRESEGSLVAEFLRGLRDDFRQGNRIFLAVILHSPEGRIVGRLEWERLQLQISFFFWYWLISARLRMKCVSVHELRRLTDVVATLAYKVRQTLALMEESGKAECVQSILRSS